MQIPNVVIVADAELAESLSKSTPDHPYGFGKNASYDDLDAFLGESGILKVGGVYLPSTMPRADPQRSS